MNLYILYQNVYKYIGIKNSTISSVTSVSNQYNFRPFGWLDSSNEDRLKCYYNPFLVDNSIILSIEADIFWNKTIEIDDNWRSNFYSLNQKYDPRPVGENDELKIFGKVVG